MGMRKEGNGMGGFKMAAMVGNGVPVGTLRCGAVDPGPDPTWDPGEFPPDELPVGNPPVVKIVPAQNPKNPTQPEVPAPPLGPAAIPPAQVSSGSFARVSFAPSA